MTSLRLGTVTALNAGPPPTVSIYLSGDSASTVDALYLDPYDPAVGHTVRVLSEAGAHFVLGRATPGPLATYVQRTTTVTSITTTQVALLTTGTLEMDGWTDMEVLFSYDSWLSTVVEDRMALRIQGSFNGGTYSDLARAVPRYSSGTASQSEGGGTLSTVHPTPAAGSWTWRVTAVRDLGSGTLQVNAAAGQVMTLAVKRFL